MQQFQLSLLFQLIGIGSASGLLYRDDSIFVVSDNSAWLYQYNLTTKSLEKNALIESTVSENIPKKQKPDFEAIAHYEDDCYIFGSGSTENRNKMVQYNLKTKQTKTVDLSYLYALLQSFASIKPDDFNIEGVVFTGELWYFLQRGNGKSGQNGVFTVKGKNLEEGFTVLYNEVKLPKIKGVRASFTDAVWANGQLYFLASAENSDSTYLDGEVLGSIVGSLNPDTMKLITTQQITDKQKFEGITLYQESADTLEFLLCEDNDTEQLESGIYRLSVSKK